MECPEVEALLQQAQEAGGRHDWDTGIKCLREVVVTLGERVPNAVNENLAVLLHARAVDKASRAQEIFKKKQYALFERAVKGKIETVTNRWCCRYS